MMVLKPVSRVGQLIASYNLLVQLTVLGSPYGLDASRLSCPCFGNTTWSYTRAVYLFDEPDGHCTDVASPGNRQARRSDPHDGRQVRRLSPGRFLFRNLIPGFFYLSPDFLPPLCLNSSHGGFPKGDSSETHPFNFRRGTLSFDTFRRAASRGAGGVDQSIHPARIEAPPQAPAFKKAWRETPAHNPSANPVNGRNSFSI